MAAMAGCVLLFSGGGGFHMQPYAKTEMARSSYFIDVGEKNVFDVMFEAFFSRELHRRRCCL